MVPLRANLVYNYPWILILMCSMASSINIEQVLKIQQLRARFLAHTRHAFLMLPALDRPHILDIGCGSGLPTIELARLSGGTVVGIDNDETALSKLRRRIEQEDLSNRVTAINCSLYETDFADESFDILWGEGVLHLLDPAISFTQCHRLLKRGGALVIHEATFWFGNVRDRLPALGFQLLDQYRLPRSCWWTDYGAPLEERIRAFRETHGGAAESAELSRYEREVAVIKKDPVQSDSGFFILQKSGA